MNVPLEKLELVRLLLDTKLENISQTPYSGIEKPEPLKHDFSG